MRTLTRTLLAASGYLVLIVTFVITAARPGHTQGGPPSRDVRVINAPSEPVPVAIQGGASTVTTIPGLPGMPFGMTGSPGIVVPADRYLVIETLSVQVNVSPSGSKLEAFVRYTSSGQDVSLFVPLTYAYTANTGFDFYVATQAVRLYADPGTDVYVQVFSPTGNGGTLFLTASGFLI